MDPETHRPRDEPENTEIQEEFPLDPAHERRGMADDDEVPAPPGGMPAEHRQGTPPPRQADPEHRPRPGQR